MSAVTPEIIRYVARLARLRLDEQDLARLAAELGKILEYVTQLDSVPTDSVEPTSHVLPLVNVQRQDEPVPSLRQDTVVQLAPASQHPFVKVPKVIEG